ncbi:toxic anion resistance protein [Herbaspirillum sp. B65]|uniref:toxic anion resistance protein n=1 Tax=Herbaspirillum sp. B65 TaxID=137708 RepID=UPI0003454AD2|nr:toxic anion resistance protein [Herbaspirillum sp. B65]
MESQEQTKKFTLTPPEVLEEVPATQATESVELAPQVKTQVENQVASFVATLLKEDVQSESFQKNLDAAFRLGREQISNAAALMSGRFMDRNFTGIEESSAFKAIQSMRTQLDELNPGRQGDLMAPRKILGLIPFGNQLQAYFRKYQSAGAQLKSIMTQIYAAKDDMARDEIEIKQVRASLWQAMLKLKEAIHFAEQLDAQLATKTASLQATDPVRAKAIEQEVLFYTRQSLQDMQTQMAVNVFGYLSTDILLKNARQMINGCDRVATTGMSALATAQTVARATGNQIEVMNMLTGVSQSIGNLVSDTAKQLDQHVQKTGEFAANPLIGIQVLQQSLDTTYKAMDAMDNFRSAAIENMGKNNLVLKNLLTKSEQYIERSRAQQARQAGTTTSVIDGSVNL